VRIGGGGSGGGGSSSSSSSSSAINGGSGGNSGNGGYDGSGSYVDNGSSAGSSSSSSGAGLVCTCAGVIVGVGAAAVCQLPQQPVALSGVAGIFSGGSNSAFVWVTAALVAIVLAGVVSFVLWWHQLLCCAAQRPLPLAAAAALPVMTASVAGQAAPSAAQGFPAKV
jgi:hypothetical protein